MLSWRARGIKIIPSYIEVVITLQWATPFFSPPTYMLTHTLFCHTTEKIAIKMNISLNKYIIRLGDLERRGTIMLIERI